MSALYSLALDTAAGVSVAELHGTAVGLLCASQNEERAYYALMDLLGDVVRDPEQAEAFVREAALDLADLSMTFDPLLPDDDEPLEFRLECLLEWISGYLIGLRPAIEANELPEEVEDVVQDMKAICEIDPRTEGSEQEEGNYVEIVEFVRGGVLLVEANLT